MADEGRNRVVLFAALSFTGHLKLTDFGLSRHLAQGTRAYTICGTLQYMGETGAKAGG